MPGNGRSTPFTVDSKNGTRTASGREKQGTHAGGPFHGARLRIRASGHQIYDGVNLVDRDPIIVMHSLNMRVRLHLHMRIRRIRRAGSVMHSSWPINGNITTGSMNSGIRDTSTVRNMHSGIQRMGHVMREG